MTDKRTHEVTCRNASTGDVLWVCAMTAEEYDRYCRKREQALTRRPYVHPMPDEGNLHVNAGNIEIALRVIVPTHNEDTRMMPLRNLDKGVQIFEIVVIV